MDRSREKSHTHTHMHASTYPRRPQQEAMLLSEWSGSEAMCSMKLTMYATCGLMIARSAAETVEGVEKNKQTHTHTS